MAPRKNPSASNAAELMIVNDVPGEECRIAILQDGHLEELFSERSNSATNVGNIYKARVAKVEPAIQAAFVDYGEGQSGFLHITDLHPRYFPGEEKTERVGKRISRRERPLIQHALRSGNEILVQVMKQGIGTKGPTLTSYLSIPGRLMVMMPDMDRVGVSRKVEDEEQRREMRDILNGLDLPPGFGFILRTAGFGKNKTDLKRDVAYLQRLWKIMERRMQTSRGPVELYTESDLLIRTIRDVLRPSIQAIVVDSKSAYDRAAGFLRVVAPRSAPKVIRYPSHTPIFHAFDIERQVELIHSREVPLPSGGAIVIDQTEALVAIDVNSGRSRSARDSETNAYETDLEAADEICRQLRLRDLGGLIVNDLIDMRSMKHRRDIEDRFRENLKRDRARTMITRISEFGILEMTRQRMRPSMRKLHYMPCPHCAGHGEVKMPESIGADATRQIGYLLQFDRVKRVELVCSPRVASVLLSGKRRELVAMEDATGKTVDVRVSDAIAIDRVDYYAYDERGADIDIDKLPRPKMPTVAELERRAAEAEREQAKQPRHQHPAHDAHGPADAARIVLSGEFDDLLLDDEDEIDADEGAAAESTADSPMTAGAGGNGLLDGQSGEGGQEGGRRRRRRRRRGGRGRGREGGAATDAGQLQPPSAPDRDEREIDERPRGDDWSAPVMPADSDADLAPAEALPDDFDATVDSPEPVSASSLAMRVHQLARQLGVKSKEIIERCAELAGLSVKNHMSSVPSDVVEQIVTSFQPEGEEPVVADSSSRDAIREELDDERWEPDRVVEDGDREWTAESDRLIESPVARGTSEQASEGEAGGGRGRRRRRRRRGRGGRGGESAAQAQVAGAAPRPSLPDRDHAPQPERNVPESQEPGGGGRRKRRRRRGRGGGGQGDAGAASATREPARDSGGRREPHPPTIEVRPQGGSSGAGANAIPAKTAKPRRALYRSRTKLSKGSRGEVGPDLDE